MKLFVTYLLVITLGLPSLGAFGADSSTTKYEKNIYRKSWNFGFILHTKGLGLNFRKEKFKTALIKNFWTIEGYNIKSAKEQKSYGSSGDNSKSFIYGKMNHLYVLKAGVGRQKVLFEKEVIRGVQISTIYNIDFALGFLKPIYLEVFKPDQNNPISTERYDPTVHRLGEISGKASWFRGLDDMNIVPGLSAKFALNFEFAPKDNKIKALETGVNVDAFMKPMQIMAFQSDQYVFVNLYLNFQFGRKRYL